MREGKHPAGHALLARLDGELAGAEAAAIEEHCAECDACREELSALREVRDRLAAEPPPPGPAPIWPRVAPLLRRREEERLTPAFAFAATAACVLGIMLGVLVGSGDGGDSLGGAPPASVNTTWHSSVGGLWGRDESGSLLDVYGFRSDSMRFEES